MTDAQRDAVTTALAAEQEKPQSPGKLLAEIAAYIGAGAMLGALALLLTSSWDDLQRTGRIVIFALVSVGLAVGAIALAGGISGLFSRTPVSHTSRSRLATVLFALASISVAVSVGSALDSNPDRALVCACIAGLVVALLGYLALPSVIGIFAAAWYSVGLVLVVLDEVFDVEEVWVGLGLLALGAIWFALTRFGVFVENWAGYIVAILISVTGAVTVDSSPEQQGFVLTALVAVVCFVLYATQRSAVLVIGGSATVALAVAMGVGRLFDGEAGVLVAIVIVGAVVLAVGTRLLTRSPSRDTQRPGQS